MPLGLQIRIDYRSPGVWVPRWRVFVLTLRTFDFVLCKAQSIGLAHDFGQQVTRGVVASDGGPLRSLSNALIHPQTGRGLFLSLHIKHTSARIDVLCQRRLPPPTCIAQA